MNNLHCICTRTADENLYGQSLNNVCNASIQRKVEYNRPVPSLLRMCSK